MNESVIILGGQFEQRSEAMPETFSLSQETTTHAAPAEEEEEENKSGSFGSKDGGPTEAELVHRYPMNEMWVLEVGDSFEKYLAHEQLKNEARQNREQKFF